jgi:hypothetical protein
LRLNFMRDHSDGVSMRDAGRADVWSVVISFHFGARRDPDRQRECPARPPYGRASYRS